MTTIEITDDFPSSDWTQEERGIVIQIICAQFKFRMQGGFIPMREIIGMFEKISFLSSQGPNFLEINREQILENLDGAFEME